MKWIQIHGGARSLANKHNWKNKIKIWINITHELVYQNKGATLHYIGWLLCLFLLQLHPVTYQN
jgi:hypothetical protein